MPPGRAPPPPEGVEFPEIDGKRGSMEINQGCFAAAVEAVDKERAKKVREEKKWRGKYVGHVCENVRASLRTPEAALDVARAGLDYLHNHMVFVRDGKEVPVKEAMAKYTQERFKTREIRGKGSQVDGYGVPYKTFGTKGDLKNLTGDQLRLQVDEWVRKGVIEVSTAHALNKVSENPGWCDLSDQYFVLFGASSAMGPFPILMDHGANVIALDLWLPPTERRPDGFADTWERLFAKARSSSGRLIFPVREDLPADASDKDLARAAGCNLITEAPEIRTWLMPLMADKQFILFALAYLDGALFVKVSVAMDAIIQELVKGRKVKPALAYLCTPSDVHVRTAASAKAADTNFRRATPMQKLIGAFLGLMGPKMAVRRNVERAVLDAQGNPLPHQIVDAIVPQQGPNYILAKRLQHWRAMLAREDGCLVSSNVAPSTATASVLSNVIFALSYKGFAHYKPMEVTYPDTSNAVMAACLINDIRNPTSVANPEVPLANPLCLFTENAFHGGAWRAPYKFGSLGGAALLSYAITAFIVAPYLLCYSAYQAQGWTKAFVGVAQGLLDGKAGLWESVGGTVSFFQYLGLMEVAHAALGLTSSSAAMTLLQIFSRIAVVSVVTEYSELYKSNPIWIKMMLFAWTLTEMVRYTFYSVSQLRDLLTTVKGVLIAMKKARGDKLGEARDAFPVPGPLVWLRYSLFIVLYPMGVAGEIGTLWIALADLIKSTSTSQSHKIGVFLMDYILRPILAGQPGGFWGAVALKLLVYGLGLPPLYMMLLAARRKNLGGGKRKAGAEQKEKKQQ
eukprot:TRINITY_DN49954_c0_g1_i1.p1 TRINITY_DN49954_c0_g1~~TRINITY_DN49954_c0_g1_i1.p1  ORF type:complete len:823 (+),score=349.38 TRINITY_DN49954_c0_g1_i1:85-2469(+)